MSFDLLHTGLLCTWPRIPTTSRLAADIMGSERIICSADFKRQSFMQTTYAFDPTSQECEVIIRLTTAEPLEGSFRALVDSFVSSTASIVNAQGLAETAALQSLEVMEITSQDEGRTRSFTVRAHAVHPAAWRVLAGLFHGFDMASMPIQNLSFLEAGRTPRGMPGRDLLTIGYPSVRRDSQLPLSRSSPTGRGVSIEIALNANAKKSDVAILTAALNSWLVTCSGGFFNEGEHPVTNAHDCAAFEAHGARLLGATFGGFSGSQSAFDVLVNQLSFFHSRLQCIQAVKLY